MTPAAIPGPILLVGAEGQLGRDLARRLVALDPVALGRAEVDVTDREAVDRTVRRVKPALVLNAAAYNQVDGAEDDPEGAFRVNAIGVHHLARACHRTDARLVHFSTDYVFDGLGRQSFAEEDLPSPPQVYGVSKLAGELLVRAASPRHLVIRTCALYGLGGSRAKGGNFVETMLGLAREGKPIRVVDDQFVSPTYTRDLADAVARLLAVDPPGGVYHLTNGGACSFFEFAHTLFTQAGLRPDLAPVKRADRPSKARRAASSLLRDTRLAGLGLPPLRPWPEALRAYLAERASRGASS